LTPIGQRIRGFDGLRAIAFLLVFMSHKIPFPLTDRYGTIGVWLFFVLSGFLITRILANSCDHLERGVGSFRGHLSNFYIRRTARIFPAYYLFLLILSALAVAGLVNIGERSRQLANWLYLTNIYVGRRGWGTDLGHLWSLAVEEQFYIFFAPLALALRRQHLSYLCGVVLFGSVLAHIILVVSGTWVVSLDVNSFLNFGLLAIGGLAALGADRRLPQFLSGNIPILTVLVLFLIVPILGETDAMLAFGRLSGFLLAILLIQIYQAQHCRMVSLLDIRPLSGLGLISYGAYLFHPVIKVDGILHAFGYGPLPAVASLSVELLATIGLAAFSWRVLENPIRRIGRAMALREVGSVQERG
jgi:peptidoglycan/LPS O-acetylase OafA/YrhL